MNRREALLALGGVAVLTEPLLAAGRSLRTRLGSGGVLKVLDPHQNDTVVTIADLIIPATETPGASAAKVNEFTDLMLADWVDAEERTRFLEGLADFDARSRKKFGKDLTGCTPAQQTELLELLDLELAAMRDAERQGVRREPTPAQSFFHMMKRVTLLGYYTSEVGATEELHNPIIPGRYDGCVLLERRGN
jgi:hypothetical protein